MSAFAMLFPGQGSQSVGMLSELADGFPEVRETFREAGDALSMDLWKLVREGPEADLNRTENTQPALLAAGVAVWRAWQAAGGDEPAMAAGHSLGEYTALVCAGSLNLAAGVRLVAQRGRLMQEAAPDGEGSMAAILGLEDVQVEQLCEKVSGERVVAPANYNAPGQIVIAGHADAVEAVCKAGIEAGARRAMVLPVSVPSHCILMAPAAEQMAGTLGDIDFSPPGFPIVHNVDACRRRDAAGICQALVDQLSRPVLWTQSFRAMAAEGIAMALECGPGRVLCGLGKRIERGLPCQPLETPGAIETALAKLEED